MATTFFWGIVILIERRRQCDSYWSDTIGWLTHEGGKKGCDQLVYSLGKSAGQSYEFWGQIL
jgi:hypothetical protein